MDSAEYRKQGSGPPFIYVAGIEGTGRLFYKQAEDIARDHTLISFPLRPTGRYTIDQLVNDLVEIIRDSAPEPATLLGESFGGVLAMSAALAHPNLFRRMILVNTFPVFENRLKINLAVAAYSLLPYRLVQAFRRRRSHRELFGDDVTEEDRQAFHHHTSVVPYEGYLSRLRIIRQIDLRPHLHKIETPTLVVAGTSDRLLDSVSAARTMVGLLPRAKLKLLPETGHTALISSRVRVRDWLSEFGDI